MKVRRPLKVIFEGITKPPIFFTILAIYVAFFSYESSAYGDQYQACLSGLRNADELKSEFGFDRIELQNLRIYSTVSKINARQLGVPYDDTNINDQILNLENSNKNNQASVSEMETTLQSLCGKIDHDKGYVDLTYLFLTAILAVYGFWAGLRSGKEK